MMVDDILLKALEGGGPGTVNDVLKHFERRVPECMVRIALTQAAFDAISATLPLCSVGYENETNERGERLIWLDHAVVNRLRAMRGPGESYSDVILKLVEADAHAPVIAREP
jgi:hypothetical protein